MSLIEKLDEVLAIRAEWENVPATELRANEWEDLKLAAARLLRDHGPAIRQAMIDARRFAWWFDGERNTSDAITALMIRDLSGDHPTLDQWRDAIDAAIDARLASDSEGGSDE